MFDLFMGLLKRSEGFSQRFSTPQIIESGINPLLSRDLHTHWLPRLHRGFHLLRK